MVTSLTGPKVDRQVFAQIGSTEYGEIPAALFGGQKWSEPKSTAGPTSTRSAVKGKPHCTAQE